MNHHVCYCLYVPHYLSAHGIADAMAFGYADFWVDQHVDIHQAIAAHASGAQHVQGDHIVNRINGFGDLFDFFRFHGGIDEFLGTSPGKFKTDFTHHKTNANGSQVPFRWSSLNPTQKAALDQGAFDGGQATSKVLNFLRGDRSNENPAGNLRRGARFDKIPPRFC